MKWGEVYFANNLNIKDMIFIQVSIDKNTGRIFRPNSVFTTQKKIQIIRNEYKAGKGVKKAYNLKNGRIGHIFSISQPPHIKLVSENLILFTFSMKLISKKKLIILSR